LSADIRRRVLSVTFLLTLLCLLSTISIPSEAVMEIGKYRESFENAQLELKKINESLAPIEGVNISGIEELRDKVSNLKADLNVTDMDAMKERLEIESDETATLRSEVSKLELWNKRIFSGVFGTFGLLAGFWSVFLLYTFLSTILRR